MKNVLLILVLMGGFAISGLHAQNCPPCPPCPACPKGCCIGGTSKASNASAQIMPATLDITGKCSPEAMAACHDGKKMSKKEMKACQAACPSGAVPSCHPSAVKTAQPAGTAVDEQFHQAPVPQKG